MTYRRTLILVCLAAVILLACNVSSVAQNTAAPVINPTLNANTPVEVKPTNTPKPAGPACPAGSWTVKDLGPSVMAAIPPEVTQQITLSYKNSSGKAVLTLAPDGTAVLELDQLKLNFDVKASLLSLPMVISADGKSTGAYQVQGSSLTLMNMTTDGITTSAKAAGQDLIDSSQILASFPLLVYPFNTANFSCQGNTLQLKIATYPDDVPALEFEQQ